MFIYVQGAREREREREREVTKNEILYLIILSLYNKDRIYLSLIFFYLKTITGINILHINIWFQIERESYFFFLSK